jgi:hypothetical protein
MNHCRNLAFEEKPDYDYLISLMADLALKEGFDLETSKDFDWVTKGLTF